LVLPIRLPSDRPLRLLCLGAHPDDIEIGCGGTVLRLVEERPDLAVRWVVFSGSAERRHEARAAAGAFLAGAAEARVETHAFRDGYFPWIGAEVKDAFERLKRDFDPDLILTHAKADAHQDHRLVADLTYNTWRNHLILEYEVPKMEGDIGNPALFVALAEAQVRRKVDVLMAHFATQRGRSWFTPETFTGLMRLRGINASSPTGWAEAFYARKLLL
jgi:LmbE family N-acetylglucosaminyl deacetylase